MNRLQNKLVKETIEDWINRGDLRVVDILNALAEHCEDESRYQTNEHLQPDQAIGAIWQNYADEIKYLANKLDKA